MLDNVYSKPLAILVILLSAVALAQVNPQRTSVVVNGRSGEAAVVSISGRTYIDVENLAQIANGSLGFHGQQITLTLPGSAASAPVAAPEPQHPAPTHGLSQNFMVAGIEVIAELREWGTTMAYAIQNQYGVTANWANDYRQKTAASLAQASASASTDADRNALQLLTNEFTNVGTWSDSLVKAKERMDTAKYSTSPDALRNEPLSQKIVTCGRFLAQMLGSGEFKDDGSCH